MRPEVVYHLACLTHWRDVLAEQAACAVRAGLTEWNVSMLGSQGDRLEALAMLRRLGVRVKEYVGGADLNQYEYPGIELVERIAAAGKAEWVLYFHGKGVTYGHKARYATNWRRGLMLLTVIGWQTFLPHYPAYDVFGAGWDKAQFYAGNFWLAKSAYLRTLPRMRSLWGERHPLGLWQGHHHHRFANEWWLGINCPRAYDRLLKTTSDELHRDSLAAYGEAHWGE